MELQLRPRFVLLFGALLAASGCTTETPPLIPADSSIVAPDGAIPRPDGGPPPTCEAGLIDCSGTCTSVVSDSLNCGSCGNVCPTGVTCALGRCDCEAPMLGCDGVCIDPSTDLEHCGACGNRCEAGESCLGGSCVVNCDEPAARCANPDADGPRFVCADTATDPMNCGECGTRCAGGSICEDGRCACPSGQINCSGVCTDISTDANNCGACLNSCGADGVCTAGTCTSCGTGLSACGTPARCTDTSTSLLHCGACGNTCGPGESCTDGACDCLPGFSNCGSLCVSFSGDPRNCGGCGIDCGPGGMCSDGACICAAGTMECGAECADLNTSAEHCGACDAACEPGERCFAGECRLINDTCVTATPVTGDVVFSGANTEDGGPRPMGSNCGDGASNKALYYAVTIPPGHEVAVTTTTHGSPDPDLVLFEMAACGETSCTRSTDFPESLMLANVGETAVTRYIGVRGYSAAGGTFPGGVFDIQFAYSVPVVADNASCTGATEITATTSLMAENTEEGGPRPSSSCGSGDSNKALYYAVTIPAGVEVDVVATPATGVDLVLFEMSGCEASSCSRVVDEIGSLPERLTLSNADITEVTRIIGVRGYNPAGDYAPGGLFDIAFTYHEPAANAFCPDATVITETTMITGQSTRHGGPRPTGPTCGGGSGAKALYYAVTVPAGGQVRVQTMPSGDIVLFEQAACDDIDCTASTDAYPEEMTLLNPGSSDVTRIIGVRAFGTGSPAPTFSITFTYSTTTFETNASCTDATPINGDSMIMGEDTGLGGPRPSGAGCGSGSGLRALYYAVSIPAGQAVTVDATPTGGSIVVFEQAACGDTSCVASAATTLTLLNPEATDVTRIVGVRASSAATSPAPIYDIEFTYSTPAFAPNASCSSATPITTDAMIAGEDTGTGGPRPTGTNCGSGTGPRALYYAVTIPRGDQVVVQTMPSSGSDIVLFEQAACGDTSCATSTDSNPERLTLSNVFGDAEVTRIIGVRAFGSPTTPPTYDIAFTYSTPVVAANALCETATVITATAMFTGEDTESGGPRPTGTNCGFGSANKALYYAVTVPAGGSVTVRATPVSTVDLVLFEQVSCGGNDCNFALDDGNTGGVETRTLSNTGTTDVVRIIGVRGYNMPGSGVSFPGGAFDISFTYTP